VEAGSTKIEPSERESKPSISQTLSKRAWFLHSAVIPTLLELTAEQIGVTASFKDVFNLLAEVEDRVFKMVDLVWPRSCYDIAVLSPLFLSAIAWGSN